MKHGGAIIGGARSRLLPASIPYRFFGAAQAFHILAWAALAIAADDVPGFAGGTGLPLASLHLLTLGVLVATAMGAAFQLLSVATRISLRAVWPARLVSWLFLPGVLALSYGMATGDRSWLAAGAGPVIAGLVVFFVLIADNLLRTRSFSVPVAYAWSALVALIGLTALGALLVTDYGYQIVPNHRGAALAHLIVAVYGFMGLLALGFSHVLVPIFALAEPPSPPLGYASLASLIVAIAIGVGGALIGQPYMLAIGAVFGLAGASLHVASFIAPLRKRLRRNLGLSFVLIRAAWALLPLSLVLGGALALDWPIPNGPTLFGFLAVYGWLLTFVLGVLQRIMPFLAVMHASRHSARPPLISQISPEGPLRVHAACHAAALILVTTGIALDAAVLVRSGAVVGAIGAAAFGAFGTILIWHMSHRLKAEPRRKDETGSFSIGRASE